VVMVQGAVINLGLWHIPEKYKGLFIISDAVSARKVFNYYLHASKVLLNNCIQSFFIYMYK